MTKRDFIKMCGGAALAGAVMPVWAGKGKKKPYTGRKVRIAAIATRFPGKRLTFDATQMRFTECAEANALMRPDWSPAALAEYGAFL